MSGLLGWLRQRIGGTPAPGAVEQAPGPGGAEAPAAPGEGAAASSPFAPFARALGIPEPPPAEPGPDPDLDEQAALVLGHFRQNRPGPASAPSLSLRILNLVAAPDADIGELSRLVSADPAVTAGVLTVANSALYRGVQEIETVREAISRLGFEEVARIAGALSARSLFNPRLKAELAAFGPRFGDLYHRALTVASGAAWQVMQGRAGRSDRAFLGGMLHDVGKSVALRSVAALALEGKLALPEGGDRLSRLLDRVHLEVGGETHQEWNLPQYLTVIAVRHHDGEVPAGEDFADLHAVRLVAAVHDLRAEPAFAARAAAEVVQSAGALGISPNAVRALSAELRDTAQRVAVVFGLESRPRA